MRSLVTARILIEAALVVTMMTFATRLVSKPQIFWQPEVVYCVPTDQKLVALTFDDGPHPKFTPQILDILDRYHVKATFFMVGKEMVRYPGVVKDVVKRGHVIGNHTYSHPHDIELDTHAQVVSELEKCAQVIEKLTGARAHLFRPPRGLVDGTVFQAANENGYRVILWTVCADHHDAPTPQLMAKRVLQHIRPGGIVLIHDGMNGIRYKDVAATKLIISELVGQGYKFVTVPELIKARQEYCDRTPSWPRSGVRGHVGKKGEKGIFTLDLHIPQGFAGKT
ncbi:MAG: polysaccharide deacetylase family protein [Armatimonadota bacterium]|nr:polysaccharide deacetylase family protein [bacterium]